MSNKLNDDDDDESQSRNGYEMGERGMSGAHDTVVRRVQTPILSAAFPLTRARSLAMSATKTSGTRPICPLSDYALSRF